MTYTPDPDDPGAPVHEPVPGPPPSPDDVRGMLAGVIDPELHASIVDLGMVDDVRVESDGTVVVKVALTTAGCPLRVQIRQDVESKVRGLPGVGAVKVEYGEMTQEQKSAAMQRARFNAREEASPTEVPSTTRVLAVASGKGGVGKSSVTVNLAVALAARGLTVGVLDADIYGHSVPRMLGATGSRPTPVEQMIMPPVAHGVKLISIGMFTAGNTPVVWRGPMLHRALQQFLADVYWGDLDVLLLDLPPGTGDIAISVAQLVPNADILVVTTPQQAAAEVAERAGAIALQTHQQVIGVVANMSWLELPDV